MNEPGQQQQQQQQQHRWLPPPPLQPTAPPGTTATATAAVPVRRQQQQQQQQILRHNDSYGYNTTLQEKKSVTFLQDDDHFHRPRQLILVRSNSSKDCSECSRLEFKANRDMIVSDKTFGPLGPPPRQPRTKKFIPRKGKIGHGKVSSSSSSRSRSLTLQNNQSREDGDLAEEEAAADDHLLILNQDLLNEYKIDVTGREPIKAGDVIMAARPFVHVMATSCRGQRCEGCFQKTGPRGLKVICGCRCTFYCSEDCREGDRENHEDECYYFKKAKRAPTSDTARFLLRFILKMRNGGHLVADLIPGRSGLRRFSDLLDHYDDILGSSRHDMVQAYYEEILRLMGLEDAPDPDYFLECYGRMAINSFHILDEDTEAIGSALYIGPSVMDHSCRPNASVSFDGVNLIVRTLVDKPRGHDDFGSEVFISYLDLLNDTRGRREKLLKQYYFWCGCDRCQDPDFERGMYCVLCVQCSKEVYVGFGFDRDSLRPEPCSECGTDLDERSLSKYAETCEIVSEKLNGSQFPVNVFQFCSKLLTQSRLSPFHILFLRCTEPTFENLLEEVREHGDDVSDDLLESALFHGLNLVSGYAKYSSHPGWSHQGLYNLKVAELEFVLGNNQDCRRHLLKAQEILRLAQGNHGSAHLARAQKLLSLLDT